MFKLARLTDYAVVILLDMSRANQKLFTASEICERTAIPLPTVQKLLKQLTTHKLLTSQRGKSGGYKLNKIPETITLAEILKIMEGPLSLTACVDGAKGDCNVEKTCLCRGRWDIVNQAVKQTLASLTLKDMLTAENITTLSAFPKINTHNSKSL